jgi:hypothetical protein
MGGHLSSALLVVDHQTGEVIAHVGSPGYLDDGRFGAVDMTDAVRSPGSTLKPLIYGLAFEGWSRSSETLIEERAGALRALCAEELRSELARHRHHPHGAGAVAEHSRGEGARRRLVRPSCMAACSRSA